MPKSPSSNVGVAGPVEIPAASTCVAGFLAGHQVYHTCSRGLNYFFCIGCRWLYDSCRTCSGSRIPSQRWRDKIIRAESFKSAFQVVLAMRHHPTHQQAQTIRFKSVSNIIFGILLRQVFDIENLRILGLPNDLKFVVFWALTSSNRIS